MISKNAFHKCFICFLVVFTTSLQAIGCPDHGTLNTEIVELGELSDHAEDKKDSFDSDLEFDPAILIANFYKSPIYIYSIINRMMTRFPFPEFDVFSPPPEPYLINPA